MKRKEREALAVETLEHWYANLMLAYAGELASEDIDGSACPICMGCEGCPLKVYGTGCDRSPWMKVFRNTNLGGDILGVLVADECCYLENCLSKWVNAAHD